MKKRTKRLLAMLLASAMILQQGSTVAVLATESEPTSETVTEKTAAAEAETKTPETKAPETQAETKASETTVSETQATGAAVNATQTETTTSETTETAAETTEKAADAQTTAPEESETKADAEAETKEAEEKAAGVQVPKTNFTYEDNRVKITAVAQEAAKLPQDAQIHADYMQQGTAAYNEAAAALEAAYAGKDVVLSYVFYDIYFTAASAGDGRIEPEAGTVTVSMQFKQPELTPEADAKVQTYDVVHVENGKAQEVPSTVQTTGDGSVASVGFTSSEFSPFAVVMSIEKQDEVATIGLDGPMAIDVDDKIYIGDDANNGSVTKVEVLVDDKPYDANNPYPRNQQFSFKLSYSFNNTEVKPTRENNKVYYKIPPCLEGAGVPSPGIIYGGADSNTEIGKYEIVDGELVLTFNDVFFDTLGSSDITGYFKFYAKIKESELENKTEYKVDFPGTVDDPSIKFEHGEVKGEKKYTGKNDADGTMDVSITFQVTGEDAKNVTFTDTMGDNLEYVENSVKFVADPSNGGSYTEPDKNALETALREEGTCTLGDLPIGTYTITYKVRLKDRTNLDTDINANTVNWQWGSDPSTGTGSSKAQEWNFQKYSLNKQDGQVQSDGTIKWTVTLTPDQFSTVLGRTLTDTLGTSPKQSYVGKFEVSANVNYSPVVVYSADDITKADQVHLTDNGFTYTFPAEGYSNLNVTEAAGKTFTVTYYTMPEDPTTGGTYSNTVDEEEHHDDGKVDYKPADAPGKDFDIVTKAGEASDVIGGERKVSWTITIDPKDYKEVKNMKLQDYLYGDGNLKSYFLKNTLKVTDAKTKKKTYSYNITWEPESQPRSFTLEFNEPLTEQVIVTVDSWEDADYGDAWEKNGVDSTYTIDGEAGKEHDKAELTTRRLKTDFKKTGDISGRTATWTVTANKMEHGYDENGEPYADLGNGTYYIEDQLPDGMEYVSGSASYKYYVENNNGAVAETGTVEPTLEADGKLRFAFTNVGKKFIVLTYQTRIKGTINETATYTNKATFGNGSENLGKADATVKLKSTLLTKEAVLAEGKRNVLHYTIHVNHAEKDLISGSETITLVDTMDSNTSIDLSTLKVVSMKDPTEEIVPVVEFGLTEDGREILHITIPDETAVTISYDVNVAGEKDQTVTVVNTAQLEGVLADSVSEESSLKIKGADAGADAKKGSIKIRKIDGDTWKPLAGAVFELYKVKMADPVNLEDEEKCDTGTTGTGGILEFPTEEKPDLDLDTLYYFQEKTPPDGYQLDDEKYYFVIKGSSYDDAVRKINGQVTFKTCAGGNTINVTNEEAEQEKGNLTVTKNVEGNNTDTTTTFHFKVTLTNSDGTSAAVNDTFDDVMFTNGVARFDLTPRSSGTASKTITGLPAGLKYEVEEYTNAGENTGYTLTGTTGATGTITADSTKTAVFTNTRNKTATELQVKKTYNGVFPTEKGKRFSFTLEAGSNDVTPAISTPMPEGSAAGSKTVEVTSEEAVTFGGITYEKDGIYNYTITENSGSLHGVTYDTSVYHVKVEVTTDGTGAKKAEISVAKAENAKTSVGDSDYQPKEGTIYTAEFNNTYVADGSAELSVQKVYNGGAYPTGDKAFKFTLTAGNNTTTDPTKVETPMPAGSSIDGKTKTVPVTSGAVQSFGTIKYEQDGDYFYTIEEVTTGTGLLSDVIYDAKVYHIKVSVTTKTEGATAAKKATVSYSLSDEGPWTDTTQAAFTATFTNYKVQDAKAELKVNKTYAYATWPTGDNVFKFVLTGKKSKKTDGTVIDTPMPTPSVIQVSKDNPTATFGKIIFPADGTYLYQISEQEGTLTDITYDDTVYDVKISVSTNTDGSRNVVIQSKKSTEGEESYAPVSGTVFTAEFVNIHKEELKNAGGSLTLNATKTMKKDSDKSRIPEFQFELAWAGTGKAPAEQTLPMTVNAAADGTISFTLDFDMDDYEAAHPETGDPKEFKYTLKEVKGSDADVIYDDTTYNITVTLGNEIGTDDKFGVTYTVEGNKALTFINDTKTEVQIEKVDEEGKALSGAKLVIRDASGKIVDGPWISDGKPHSVKLLNGKYTLSEIEAPAGYEVSKDVPFEVPDKEGNTVIKVKMTDKKIVETKRSLKVTKRLHLDGITSDIMVRAATYYVALFTDAARTQRVTDVKKIVFNNENTSSATFDNLAAGVTYYVGETDENGTVIPAGKISENMIYYPTYDDNATFTFEGKKAKEEGLAEFTNVYTEWPKYFYLSGQLTVTKQVLLGGEECDSEDTFYARVFNDAKLTDPVSDEVLVLDMAGGSRTSVTVTNLPIGDTPESSRKYYVAETDEYGNPLDPDEVTEYTISIDKSEVTLDASSAGAEVVITNDFHEEESEFESESEVDEKKTAPKTGDDTNFAKYLFLLTLSAGTCAVLFEEKRRKDRAEQQK